MSRECAGLGAGAVAPEAENYPHPEGEPEPRPGTRRAARLCRECGEPRGLFFAGYCWCCRDALLESMRPEWVDSMRTGSYFNVISFKVSPRHRRKRRQFERNYTTSFTRGPSVGPYCKGSK